MSEYISTGKQVLLGGVSPQEPLPDNARQGLVDLDCDPNELIGYGRLRFDASGRLFCPRCAFLGRRQAVHNLENHFRTVHLWNDVHIREFKLNSGYPLPTKLISDVFATSLKRRKNRSFGTIVERGNRYIARYRDSLTGKRIVHSFGTGRAAERWLEVARKDRDEQRVREPFDPDGLSSQRVAAARRSRREQTPASRIKKSNCAPQLWVKMNDSYQAGVRVGHPHVPEEREFMIRWTGIGCTKGELVAAFIATNTPWGGGGYGRFRRWWTETDLVIDDPETGECHFESRKKAVA